MEMIGKVRRMKLRDKLSHSAIAKATGLSRTTVKKWLKAPGDKAPKYVRKSVEPRLSIRPKAAIVSQSGASRILPGF